MGQIFNCATGKVHVVDDPPFDPSSLPVPEEISDRQFAQQLAVAGLISQAEALAFVKTGDIPAALMAIVNSLPSDQQFAAKMLISGATTYNINHPLVGMVAAANGWTDEQTKTFWRAAAAL